jgi:hypothetical protein
MTTTIEQHEKLQAIAGDTFATIKELVEAMRLAYANGDGQATDDAHDAIYAHPLSLEVRSDWCSVNAPFERAEYRILISWGGPAVQVTGTMNEHNEPATAVLQSQDWFVEWRDWVPTEDGADELLLEYARTFYFGE